MPGNRRWRTHPLWDSTTGFLLAMCSRPATSGEVIMRELTGCGFNNRILVSGVLQACNKPEEPSWENSLAVGFNHGILVSDG